MKFGVGARLFGLLGSLGCWSLGLVVTGCVTQECEGKGVSPSVLVVDESGAPVCDASVVATRDGAPFTPDVAEGECTGAYRFNAVGRFHVSASRGGLTDETDFTVVNDGCYDTPSFGEQVPQLVVE